MRESLRELCDLFRSNTKAVSKSFILEYHMEDLAGGILFTSKKQTAETAHIKECKKVLKRHANILNYFRGYAGHIITCELATVEDPDLTMANAMRVYGDLKDHFFRNSYLPIAALCIAENADPAQYEEIAARAKEIYKAIRKNHPFLTGEADSVLSSVIATTGKDAQLIADEAEVCFQQLKDKFLFKDGLQTLSLVMAMLDGTPESKAERVYAIFNALKENKHKFSSSHAMSILALLSLLDDTPENIAQDIIDCDEYLKGFMGFGNFMLGAKSRRMYAGILVATDRLEKARATSAATTAATEATTAIIIITEMIIITTAIAASAAASRSSNSSGK